MNYFEINERNDHKYLTIINTHLNLFQQIPEYQTTYSIIDYQLIDRKGRKCNVELKKRGKRTLIFPEIFLEKKKWDKFKEDYEKENLIPIFINFFDDEKMFHIINLTPYITGERRIMVKNDLLIDNSGYDRYDYSETRYLVPLKDGHLFEWDEKENKYQKVY